MYKISQYFKRLVDLMNIRGAPSYTFLLYLFSEHGEKPELINSTLDFLIKYFVRRNLTDFPGTRDLDNIFINLIDECIKLSELINIKTIKSFLSQSTRFTDDGVFVKLLNEDIYERNALVTRFILSKIEEKYQTKEIYVDLWEKGKDNKFTWTIEHIFPKGSKIPKEWTDMIAGGDANKAAELQKEYVHKLGNLTITKYNPNLARYSFLKKKDLKDKKGNDIGYNNGLYLNRDIIGKKKWIKEDIKERTDKLVKEALNLYS